MTDSWNKAREAYRHTPIPEELAFAVASAVRSGSRRRRRLQAARRGLTGLLAGCACFVLLVNASPTFAQAVSGVPVLGPLARVFTVAEYTAEDDGLLLDVRLPGLENNGNEALEERVNAEITTRVQALLDEAQQRAQEEWDAYLATGGNPADYAPAVITAGYEVKYQGEGYLSFVVTVTQVRATASEQFFPYTVDLATGEDVTLRDLLGEDWKETVNASVKEQIAQRSQDPDNFYWDGSNGIEGFTSVRDDQPFYLNADGNPVVMFEEYEIAPGYMGIQEFEILPQGE